MARKKTKRKNQWASDRRSFIIGVLSNLATLLVAKIGTLLWTREKRDATIQAVPASASAPTLKIFVFDSIQARENPFQATVSHVPIKDPNGHV